MSKDYELYKSYPKITIITPVFNEESTIINTLKSIEAQTVKPDQIIIVDAESKDSTLDIINEYTKLLS